MGTLVVLVHFAITDQVGPQILLAQIKKLDPLKALAIEARYGSLQHVTGVVYPSNLKRKTEEMEDDFQQIKIQINAKNCDLIPSFQNIENHTMCDIKKTYL